MKTIKTLFTLVTCTAISFSALAKIETIRFGTEASYAPFEYLDENNQIIGFDIDIANALCQELKATCHFSNQAFDSLIPSLRARRIDAAIAGIDVTPERANKALFTQTYFENAAKFITTHAELTETSQLSGKRIGVQNGTTHQKYLLAQYPQAELVSYSSYNNAVLDMKNGRLDAVFLDSAVGDAWLAKAPELKIIGDNVTDPTYFGTGFAIALRKNNTELQTSLNQALSQIKANGTYQAILTKWFAPKSEAKIQPQQ